MKAAVTVEDGMVLVGREPEEPEDTFGGSATAAPLLAGLVKAAAMCVIV